MLYLIYILDTFKEKFIIYITLSLILYVINLLALWDWFMLTKNKDWKNWNNYLALIDVGKKIINSDY